MFKPFDWMLDEVIDEHHGDWAAYLAAYLGTSPGPATLVEADRSLMRLPSRMVRIEADEPYLIDFRVRGTVADEVSQMLLHNIFHRRKTKLAVHSVLVLLGPDDGGTAQAEQFALPGFGGEPGIVFRYGVVRVWRQSVDTLLAAGPGLAPLALITDEAAAGLVSAAGRLADTADERAPTLEAFENQIHLALALADKRYSRADITPICEQLGEAVGFRRGYCGQLRNSILELGERRLGGTPPEVRKELDALSKRDRLDRMFDRVFEAASWGDLLATP